MITSDNRRTGHIAMCSYTVQFLQVKINHSARRHENLWVRGSLNLLLLHLDAVSDEGYGSRLAVLTFKNRASYI